MRTNIEIDDELMADAMKSAGTRTKRETVETALRELIRSRSYDGLLALRGKVAWEGNLDDLRTDRPDSPWL